MVMTKEDVDDIVKLLLINNQKALQGYVIASLYFRIGEFAFALKYVSKYLTVFPDSFVAHKLQGECYEKLNRTNDALKSFRKALSSAKKKNSKVEGIDANAIKEMFKSSSEITDKEGTPQRTVEMGVEVLSPTSNESEAAISIATTDDNETHSKATFTFTVNHISSLDCQACSQPFSLANLSWRVIVMPKMDLGPIRMLSIYLQCHEGSGSALWSCNVNAEFRLLSVKPERSSHHLKVRHTFTKDDDVWGFPSFITWNEVVAIDGNYMQNDCITVEVHVDVLD